MRLQQVMKWIPQFLIIFCLGALLTSCAKEEVKPDPMTGGALIGVNYTGEGIQRFSVSESGGGSIGRYSISGDYCCTMYPRVWTPDLQVTVEWERSDCEGQQKRCTIKSAENNTWPYKIFKKTIPIEQYSELGRVYLVFLPKDDVRVYISSVGPKNNAFPSKLGFPEEPAKTKRTTP